MKRALGAIWRHLPAARGPRRVILLYHSVAGGPESCALPLFTCQMAWLAEHAEVLPIDDLLAGKGKRELRAAITFDDGYASVFHSAAPTMSALGMVGTVYVNTHWMGSGAERHASNPNHGHYPGETFMTWDELALLSAAGWKVGSHGVNHLDLTIQTEAVRMRELIGSRTEIEQRLGRDCDHFAYTWGRTDRTLVTQVSEAGYRHAATAIHGTVTDANQPLLLPRLDVRRSYSPADFQALVSGQWDFLAPWHRMRAAHRQRQLERAA